MTEARLDDVRDRVASSYERVLRSTQTSCCTDQAPIRLNETGGESVPSFGCGDPVQFAGVAEGDVVLDLGCGAGYDLFAAAERVGSSGRVIGVDMTDAMVEAARSNVEKAGLNQVEIRKGYIEELPVESSSVDWVISNCVINLSPNKPAVFTEIYRVLREGGRFSISDIVAEDLTAALRASDTAYDGCIAGAIPESEYLAGLIDAGLTDLQSLEQFVYSREDLQRLALDDGCCGSALPVDEISGRVASVRFTGVKPVGERQTSLN